MKKLRMAVLRSNPWKWELVFTHGGTPEAFTAYAKAHDAHVECGEYSDGHCYVEYGKPILIWVRSLDNVPCIVHELIHAVFGMLNARGLKHTAESEEAFTYTLEDLLARILNNRRWAVVK